MLLLDLAPEEPPQGHLFDPPSPREGALMAALDAANRRYGSGTVRLACAAPSMGRRDEAWQMHQQRRSPGFTTDWRALPQV